MNTKRIPKVIARVYFKRNTNHRVIQREEYAFWQVESFYLRTKSSHFMSIFMPFHLPTYEKRHPITILKKGNVKESQPLFERD